MGVFTLGCTGSGVTTETSEPFSAQQNALTNSACFGASLGGANECKSEDEWVLEAGETCENAGAELIQYSVGGKCGPGLYQATKFECCPVEEEPVDVCCRTVSGFQLLDSETCPEPQITVFDFCNEGGELCCDTPEGAEVVDVYSCPPAWVVGMEVCDAAVDKGVCCLTDDGPQWQQAGPCSINASLPEAYCDGGEEEPICCKTIAGQGNGNATVSVFSECQDDDEQLVEMNYCTQIVCCMTEAGEVALPYSECTFWNLTGLDGCPEAEEGEDDVNTDDSDEQVDDGNDVGDDNGENDTDDTVEEVGCCQIYDGPQTGDAVYATPSDCAAQSGNPAPVSYCEMLICCSLDEGVFEVPFHACTFLGLAAFEGITECEAPQSQCCLLDGDYVVSDELSCDAANSVDSAFCDDGACEDVILGSDEACFESNQWIIQAHDHCKLAFATQASDIVMGPACDAGGFASVTFECCVPEDDDTEVDDVVEETCCYVGIGEFEFVPVDDCNVGHDVDMAFCTEAECDEVVLGNPGLCFSSSDWESIAIKHCWSNFGTTNVSNQVFGAPCNGGLSITTFECCPEEEVVVEDVCCLMKGGPEVVPADACYDGGELTMAACEQFQAIKEVCCLLDGEATLTTANICPEAQLLSMVQCLEKEEDKEKGKDAQADAEKAESPKVPGKK
jgi:hypothetical protein